MSDQYYEDDIEDGDEDTRPERTDSEWAELRRAKKAKEKAERELADMKKQQAFAKAGIDPEDPKFSYFVKGYEGEHTAEAIKAEAVKAGFMSQETDPEPDSAPIESQGRIIQAAGTGVDQPDLATAALDQAFVQGGTAGMMQFLESQGVPVKLSQ